MKKILAIDSRMPVEMIKKISSLGYKTFAVYPNAAFDDAVSAHPDMNFLQICDKTYALFGTNVRFSDFEICNICKNKKLSYPYDVLMNAAVIGSDLICRLSSIYISALDYAKGKSVNIINVNQGYAKCNIVPVCEKNKAVITEDEGIAKKLRTSGYDVLLLKNKCVRLAPYKYGFIGGASGVIDDIVMFTGNVKIHPEYRQIYDFCNKYNKTVISLSEDVLYDYGSILPLTVSDN